MLSEVLLLCGCGGHCRTGGIEGIANPTSELKLTAQATFPFFFLKSGTGERTQGLTRAQQKRLGVVDPCCSLGQENPFSV